MKLMMMDGLLMKKMSHPTRVRGLKQFSEVLQTAEGTVAPHAGAWIET